MAIERTLLPALAALLFAAAADAQTVALDWEAPVGCPGRDEVLARLGRPGAPPTRTLTARARVVRDAGGRWTLSLLTHDGALAGERTLAADTCAELVDALALILTLTLDGAPRPVSPPPPAPPPPSPPPPGRAAAPAAPVRVEVRVVGGVDVGTLPSAAPVGSLSVAVQRGRWRLLAGAGVLGAQRVTLPSGAGADLGAARAGLRACWVPYARRVELRGCAGLDAGLMYGESFGVSHPGPGSAGWLDGALGVELAWRARRWLSLVASVEGTVMIDRPTFAIGGVGEVHTPSRLGLNAQAGAEFGW